MNGEPNISMHQILYEKEHLSKHSIEWVLWQKA